MRAAAILLLLVGCGYENSQAQLRTAIDAQRPNLHRCYAQTLVNDAEMEGTMNVLVRVPARDGRGKIDMVEPNGTQQLTNPELHGPLHRCLQRVLVGVAIGGTPIHDDLYVEYTFRFEPETHTRRIVNARARYR
jgi:hypothetical protein